MLIWWFLLSRFPQKCDIHSLSEPQTLKHFYSEAYLVFQLYSSAFGFVDLTQLWGTSNKISAIIEFRKFFNENVRKKHLTFWCMFCLSFSKCVEVIECSSFKKPDRKSGSFSRKGKPESLGIPVPTLSCEIVIKQLEEKKGKEAQNSKE